MDSLYEATTSPGTLQSQSIINLFAQNFASFNAFIYNLMVRHLLVGSGTETSGFRFEIYDYKNGQNVTPVVRAMYNGKVIFQIVPSSGNVFFGQPNSDLNAPASGFMYNASAQEIVTVNRNVVIGLDGTISAKDGDFSGHINATSGLFKGEIDCPSFSSLPTSNQTLLIQCQSGAGNQYNELYDRTVNLLTEGTMYKCVHSLNNAIVYFAHRRLSSGFWSFRFYDSSRSEIATISASRNWGSTNYSSPWSSQSFSLNITYGEGDVFTFKNLPNEDVGLEEGQVWIDEDGILHAKISDAS